MCYNVKASLEAQLKRAREQGDADLIAQIQDQMAKYEVENYYHTNGFDHKPFLVYQKEDVVIANWGLVPNWIKSVDDKHEIWNKTLNARGESLWEKPAFKDSARNSRCLICIDGFYEYHHFRNKSYPFFIQPKSEDGLTLGGLSSEWLNPENGEVLTTFTIVTTEGNSLLSKLHNNPKLKQARMPLILNNEQQEVWLNDEVKSKELIVPHEVDLQIHTVEKLSGNTYKGNRINVSEEKIYPELEFEGVYKGSSDELTLF